MRMRPFSLLSVLWLLLALPIAAGADDPRSRPGDYVINRPASLYVRPAADSHIIRQLQPHTQVHVVDVLPQWYKVQSTTGKESGFVRRSYADPVGVARGGGEERGREGGGGERLRFRAGKFKLSDPVVVRDQPSSAGQKVTTLRAGSEVRVTDKDPSGLWYKIESESGNRPPGWIPTLAAKRIESR